MNPQPRAVMTADEFKAWRTRMGWNQAQAAHVLMVTPTSVGAYENDRAPVDAHMAHLCESAELLRTLASGNFFGNAIEVVRHHHAALQKRMDEAAAMATRKPRLSDFYDHPSSRAAAVAAAKAQAAKYGIAFQVVPVKDDNEFNVLVTYQDRPELHVGDFDTEVEAEVWIGTKAIDWLHARNNPRGVSDEQMKAMGILPAGAVTVGGMRFTGPSDVANILERGQVAFVTHTGALHPSRRARIESVVGGIQVAMFDGGVVSERSPLLQTRDQADEFIRQRLPIGYDLKPVSELSQDARRRFLMYDK